MLEHDKTERVIHKTQCGHCSRFTPYTVFHISTDDLKQIHQTLTWLRDYDSALTGRHTELLAAITSELGKRDRHKANEH